MRIKDLKTKGTGVHSVSIDVSVEQAARSFIEFEVGSLVVYDGEKLVGIFTKNDLVRCCAQRPDGTRDLQVSDHMQRDLHTASVDDDLDEVIASMIAKGIRHVPILERGRVVGMVTPLDILEHQKGLLIGEHAELLRYIRGSW